MPATKIERDYSQAEIEAMSREEKMRMFANTFKFKSEMLTPKILLMTSSLQDSEITRLK